jgi:hypothetical protein
VYLGGGWWAGTSETIRSFGVENYSPLNRIKCCSCHNDMNSEEQNSL